jgi:hypothetical protein
LAIPGFKRLLLRRRHPPGGDGGSSRTGPLPSAADAARVDGPAATALSTHVSVTSMLPINVLNSAACHAKSKILSSCQDVSRKRTTLPKCKRYLNNAQDIYRQSSRYQENVQIPPAKQGSRDAAAAAHLGDTGGWSAACCALLFLGRPLPLRRVADGGGAASGSGM